MEESVNGCLFVARLHPSVLPLNKLAALKWSRITALKPLSFYLLKFLCLFQPAHQ